VLPGPLDERSACNWQSHWGFSTTPFLEHDPPYVSLPSQDEAARRLAECVQAGQRCAELIAEAGLGKTIVLRRVLAEGRGPRRRCILVSCPRQGDLLPALLAEHLGERVGREPGRLACWRAIERALRLTSIVGCHVVVGVDDCQNASRAVRRDIEALASLGTAFNTRLTIIQAGRPSVTPNANRAHPWSLAIGLDSLTRSETQHYLTTKLAAGGCDQPVFTPRAVTRLHSSTAGVPRSIDQLAVRCLRAGASQRIAVIPHELVDAVVDETPGVMLSTSADRRAG
jgi:type II secretory pathway predicted ATPase ExeA